MKAVQAQRDLAVALTALFFPFTVLVIKKKKIKIHVILLNAHIFLPEIQDASETIVLCLDKLEAK